MNVEGSRYYQIEINVMKYFLKKPSDSFAKTILILTIVLFGLSACGGGDSNDESHSVDPYGVYQKIKYGMGHDAVRDMIGEEFNGRKFEGSGWVSYSWVFAKGKEAESTLQINVRKEGVTSKKIDGSRGNYSFYWI